jgi:CRISPR/Cas system-associated exonuclease Cas4 (RecB family)
MNKEYKKRHPGWNYGGQNWKLSRSKIDLFQECPRCFYLDNKLGVRRPSFPPFNLNNAVDTLLKKEFDIYRRSQKPHPIISEHKIDAVPFSHPELDTWRENFEGVQFVHKPTGMIISGAVDDIWVKPNGELIIVDYKSTSKDEKITLDDAWKDSYKRQMEVYQWLLRQKGFEVSEEGYFVYANASTEPEKFDGNLKFELTLLKHVGNPEWVEPVIFKIKEVLDSDKIPAPDQNCEHCNFCKFKNEAEKLDQISNSELF